MHSKTRKSASHHRQLADQVFRSGPVPMRSEPSETRRSRWCDSSKTSSLRSTSRPAQGVARAVSEMMGRQQHEQRHGKQRAPRWRRRLWLGPLLSRDDKQQQPEPQPSVNRKDGDKPMSDTKEQSRVLWKPRCRSYPRPGRQRPRAAQTTGWICATSKTSPRLLQTTAREHSEQAASRPTSASAWRCRTKGRRARADPDDQQRVTRPAIGDDATLDYKWPLRTGTYTANGPVSEIGEIARLAFRLSVPRNRRGLRVSRCRVRPARRRWCRDFLGGAGAVDGDPA